jgi:hypothetical protein
LIHGHNLLRERSIQLEFPLQVDHHWE